jgi:hypothetical protein
MEDGKEIQLAEETGAKRDGVEPYRKNLLAAA